MSSEWNKATRAKPVQLSNIKAIRTAAAIVAVLGIGMSNPTSAQSPLTDDPSPLKLLFKQGIPLPPKRPTGFEPANPMLPPKSEIPAEPTNRLTTPLAPTSVEAKANPQPAFTTQIPLPPIRPKDFASAPAELPITITNTDTTPPANMHIGKQEPLIDLPRDEVIKLASASLSELKQFQTDFTQIDGTGQKVTGHLAVARPGRLRFDYNPPSSVLVVADGNSVGVIDRKLKTRDIYSLFLTPLKFLLKSKIDLKSDITIIDVRSEPDAYVITAEDKSTFAGTSKIALSFDRHSLKIKKWTVTDPQGYDTTVILGPLDTSTEPDGDLFVSPEKVG